MLLWVRMLAASATLAMSVRGRMRHDMIVATVRDNVQVRGCMLNCRSMRRMTTNDSRRVNIRTIQRLISTSNNDPSRRVRNRTKMGCRVWNRIQMGSCVRHDVVMIPVPDVIIMGRRVRHVIDVRRGMRHIELSLNRPTQAHQPRACQKRTESLAKHSFIPLK